MEENISTAPDLKKGVYRHYRGNLYQVHGLACHSETLEWHVIYEPLYEHKSLPSRWVRPYEMFVEEIEIDGLKIPRFELFDKK